MRTSGVRKCVCVRARAHMCVCAHMLTLACVHTCIGVQTPGASIAKQALAWIPMTREESLAWTNLHDPMSLTVT